MKYPCLFSIEMGYVQFAEERYFVLAKVAGSLTIGKMKGTRSPLHDQQKWIGLSTITAYA